MSNAAQNETLGSYEKKTIKAEKQYISAHVSFADNANGSLSCVSLHLHSSLLLKTLAAVVVSNLLLVLCNL
eukprot:m.166448 g.166448  ORF g.166448 m.166448 type:complete len:71 (-) comp31428_c1_seq2:24-236(-)